ncbi:MAG: NAD(P)/FAD-dependent oxidoreductase [Pseudomonadota bacterium]
MTVPTDSPAPLVCDCLVIGAGPTGLTAAIYLARYRRRVILADGGQSRASLIPLSHNYPGFEQGVSGRELLARLRAQACACGVTAMEGEVTAIAHEPATGAEGAAGPAALRFSCRLGTSSVYAHKVLLATGIEDGHVDMPNWTDAVRSGRVRLCPICDGYDALDQHVAIVSSTDRGAAHALFMRTYTRHVDLFCHPRPAGLPDRQREQLHQARVRVIEEPLRTLLLTDREQVSVETSGGQRRHYDVAYLLLGDTARNQLAVGLGARRDMDGKLEVDRHQRTSVDGLYAAGDVVNTLHQISVGIGQAAMAATDMHNSLARNFR